MEKPTKSIWFEGSNEIQCSLNKVENSIKNIGEHYLGIISLMPGMTSVELIEQGSNSVILKTNEGLMKRSNISISIETERIVVEFDEEYQAGKTVTTNSHFLEEFTLINNNVNQHIIISDVKAPGFMGFFYRNFGSSNIGNAFLKSYKSFLDNKT